MQSANHTVPRFAWLDGEVVEWADARLHIDTQCVLGGLNAYEVIGASWSEEDEELYLFRVQAHLDRLARTMKVMRLAPAYSRQEMAGMARTLLALNGFRENAFVRIVVYFGSGPLFSHLPDEVPTGVFMFAKPAHTPSLQGLHVCTGIWQRLPDLAAPPRVKAGANYQNVRLAQVQARIDGYDDAVLLNSSGKVCELPLENLFLVRDGVLITPGATSGILEGITRRTLLDVAGDLGLTVVERDVDRSELYVADEVFSTATQRGVRPILSVDRYQVGDGEPGPVTRQLYTYFQDLLRNRVGRPEWLTPVYRSAIPAAY